MEDKVLQEKLALLNVTSNRLLCDKAKEIYRKLLSKLPIGSLGRSEQARPILAIEISCRLLNVSITHEKCARLCSVNQSEYVRVLNTCKVALGVQWGSSNVDQVLSLQYSPDLVEESKRILNYYDSHYVLQLPTDSRRYVALDSPLYKCAAFYVAAATAKQQVSNSAETIISYFITTAGMLME